MREIPTEIDGKEWTLEMHEYRARNVAGNANVKVFRDLFPVQRDRIVDAVVEAYLAEMAGFEEAKARYSR